MAFGVCGEHIYPRWLTVSPSGIFPVHPQKPWVNLYMHTIKIQCYTYQLPTYRADQTWDDNPMSIYYTAQNTDLTVKLFISNPPYIMQSEFDANLGNHDKFLLKGPYIFATRIDDGVHNLYVSYDRQPFQKAMIPTPYAQQGYIVPTSNGLQALIIIQHEGGFYNLYISDQTGVYYSLSLRDIVVDGNTIDLETVREEVREEEREGGKRRKEGRRVKDEECFFFFLNRLKE